MTENEMSERIEYLERLCKEYVKEIKNLCDEIFELRTKYNDWSD